MDDQIQISAYEKRWLKNAIFRDSDLTQVNWEKIVSHKDKNCLRNFGLHNANLIFSNLTGLNLVNTELPNPVKLIGTKLNNSTINFKQLAIFYKAGVRDFRDITLSGKINQEAVLRDALLSDSAFNYLNQQGYLYLDRVYVADPSSKTLAILKGLKKDKLEATDTISNVRSNWDGQGTLMGLNLLARKITSEKYNMPIGSFSYASQHEERLAQAMANVSWAMQSAEKNSWWADESTDPGHGYFQATSFENKFYVEEAAALSQRKERRHRKRQQKNQHTYQEV